MSSRRLFLQAMAQMASTVALAKHAHAAAPFTNPNRPKLAYPFLLGVASGSPLPQGVVLWTRLVSNLGEDTLQAAPLPAVSFNVGWEVASDEAFRTIVARGTAQALPELAHSVHVEVNGLQPERWYWYRFILNDAVSPVGRTRTAPAPDASKPRLKLAVASCQHWEFGAYGAHRQIAAQAPDLVAFLGDYIYEWGPYHTRHPQQVQRVDESFTLEQYRARYAQYKSDPDLQAAHQAAPWIITWDDHDVANDYANDRDERLDPKFIERRAAAYQAFYEHQPLRLPSLPAGPQRWAHFKIYQSLDWGQLARFYLLDDRQYRSYEACPKAGQGGSTSVTSSCAERLDPKRSMLGAAQESWLAQSLGSSKARWNILAQQTIMAQNSQQPVKKPGDGRFWTDGWDGYPKARQKLLRQLQESRATNPLVLAGDVHTFYISDLRADFDRPVSSSNPVIASEFCGTSITSSSRPQARTERYLQDNPHIQFGRSDKRGYMLIDIHQERANLQCLALDDVDQADSAIRKLAEFEVKAGIPGVKRK
ncbi:MAG: hypothetical protein RL748_212 [Pseudomonadota bacterium]|jgi:alkaline phosphatase D